MRKMIVMALVGFVWRQVQARVLKRGDAGRAVRRY